MNIFISADMEGITGVAHPTDVVKDESDYKAGRESMLQDVNAAIEGAVTAGADEILVNDSHSTMTNLPRSGLDDHARLIRGNTKPQSMMQGLTDDHDVALFIGYHAMAGTQGAVLNHTFLAHELVRLRVNGCEVGELGWNARFAAHYDVPVGLVTGDDKTAAEAHEELNEKVETVEVKRGIDRFTAECSPADETRDAIHKAAKRAVDQNGTGNSTSVAVETPAKMVAKWTTTNQAAQAAESPGIERVDGRTTSVAADSYEQAFEDCVAMLRAGYSGTNELYG